MHTAYPQVLLQLLVANTANQPPCMVRDDLGIQVRTFSGPNGFADMDGGSSIRKSHEWRHLFYRGAPKSSKNNSNILRTFPLVRNFPLGWSFFSNTPFC